MAKRRLQKLYPRPQLLLQVPLALLELVRCHVATHCITGGGACNIDEATRKPKSAPTPDSGDPPPEGPSHRGAGVAGARGRIGGGLLFGTDRRHG